MWKVFPPSLRMYLCSVSVLRLSDTCPSRRWSVSVVLPLACLWQVDAMRCGLCGVCDVIWKPALLDVMRWPVWGRLNWFFTLLRAIMYMCVRWSGSSRLWPNTAIVVLLAGIHTAITQDKTDSFDLSIFVNYRYKLRHEEQILLFAFAILSLNGKYSWTQVNPFASKDLCVYCTCSSIRPLCEERQCMRLGCSSDFLFWEQRGKHHSMSERSHCKI